MDKTKYDCYVNILKEEMVPALGCTEPIAIAYASAKAQETLNEPFTKIEVYCSGNIIKNTKCVIVPNTKDMSGIAASAITGAVAGDASKELEVIANVSDEQLVIIKEAVMSNMCSVKLLNTTIPLHIIIKMIGTNHTSEVEITQMHTHIAKIKYDERIIYEDINVNMGKSGCISDRCCLNIDDIYEFASTCEISDVVVLLDQEIAYNYAVSLVGLKGEYSVGLGKMLLECYQNTILLKMKAYTAAASEARMGGCSLPVVTNSGSGNQGISCSIPLIVYAFELKLSKEELYRALILSNLIAIHQKTSIGRLSAFCGAVSASCAAGAALSFIKGGTIKQVKDTITNTLANIPGIVCDGAKPTCAAKIATSLDGAFMAHNLAMKNLVYDCSFGILKKDIESTIASIGQLGKYGMAATDKEILSIMLDNNK